MNNYGILIKKLREERGLSQNELAKKAEIGNGTIGDIERGARTGKKSTLDKIAKALNLTKEERIKLDNAFMGREINILQDERVAQLNKRELSQYEKAMNEASLFFNDEATSEADKQKLLMAMNEMFFLSKEINKKKFAHKTDKKEEK